MAVGFSNTNKPLNPRGNDASPKGYNRAELYSGKALDFDGVNDKVTSSVNTTIFSDSGTISGYLKLDGLGGIKAGFGFRLSAQSEFYLLFVNNNSEYRMRTTDGHTDVVADLSEFVGRWTLFTCTFGAGVMKLYADGNLLASSNYTGTFVTNSSATYSFGESGSGSFWYDGQASNARVFNTALTAAQVADLYNNPEKIVPTGVADSALKLWLPMQEGAGTTVYDGSGNGNHGTISGATWMHGIGAPVSQTAVMDWNKTSNLVTYSEDFTQWGTNDSPVLTASSTIAPDGSTNAYEITDNTSSGYARVKSNTIAMSGDYIGSLYIKKTTGSLSHYPGFDVGSPGYYVIVDTTNGTAVDSGSHYSDITVTSYNDDWWRVSAKSNVTTTNNAIRIWPALSTNGTSISPTATGMHTFWGAQVEQATAIGSYVYTGATAQTSDVLLPQGLTAGRDITGVNLFENVRKQGALNLDGNSWAEVHDNASLDFGTGSFTLEAWVKVAFENTGSSYNSILTLGNGVSDSSTSALSVNSTLNFLGWYNANASVSLPATEGDWAHIIGAYDGTNYTLYWNGVQVDQDARTAATITNNLTKYIGRDSTAFRFYQDQIAQPRIYNRALTAAEVLQNYNSGKSIYTNS